MSSPRVILALIAACVALTPAGALRPREQDMAFNQAKRGRIMPLSQIIARVSQEKKLEKADYLGADLVDAGARYRLKFVKGVRVIWVDVDARQGQVLQITGD